LPNGHSRQCLLRLASGKYLLIGNMSVLTSGTRNPLDCAVSDDGIIWSRWYKVAWEASTTPTYRHPSWVLGSSTDEDYRGGGPQYPDACEHGTNVVIVYSTQKERIKCRIIPLNSFQ
jgi:hypothetical protein